MRLGRSSGATSTHSFSESQERSFTWKGGVSCFNAAEHDMTMIKLIHPVVDIAIICSNFEESLRFYHEILGLEIVFEIHISDELAQNVGLAPQGFRQVRLKAGDTLIKLADIASPPPPLSGEFSSGVNWLTLFVEDIEQTIEELKRKRGGSCLPNPSRPLTPPVWSVPETPTDSSSSLCSRGQK